MKSIEDLRRDYYHLLTRFTRRTWPVWERLGLHVVPNHFYYPIPDLRELREKRPWESTYPTTGINLREEEQIALLEQISEYTTEYQSEGTDFESHGDGAMLYAMLRHIEPEQIIEVGSGASTRVSVEATRLNSSEANISAIEPHPSDALCELARTEPRVTLVQEKVENVPVAMFRELGRNDVLFIDSSHVLTCGNDVAQLYLKVLPDLPKGVYVHIHDIWYPDEYPEEWLMEKKLFWTEQYILQSFLSFNEAFEVIWAGSYMATRYEDRLESGLPGFNSGAGSPASFWIRRVK